MPDASSPLLKPTLIFLGAGGGGLARYWIDGWVQRLAGPSFPAGTLVINVSGCLAMGFLATLFADFVQVRDVYRAGLLIGVLGGYTTFSSFGRETMALVADGQWLGAGLNVVLSNALGLAAVWAGGVIATRMYGGSHAS